MQTKQEQLKAIKAYSGIYSIYIWDKKKQKYVDVKYSSKQNVLPYKAYRRIKVLGKVKQQSKRFASLQEAKAWRMQQDGLDTNQELSNTSQGYTVRDLLSDWRQWSKPPRLAPSTWQVYGKDIVHFTALLDIKVTELTAKDIDLWLQELIDPSYPKKDSRVSFLRELTTLTTVLNWYREYKNETYHPPVLKRHRNDCFFKEKPKKQDLALSVKDLERFLNQLKHHHMDVYYLVASFQALTGARIGEVCGLKWESVDLSNETARIERTCYWHYRTRDPELRESTKTSEDRTVVLPQRLVKLLREWKMKSYSEKNTHNLVFHKQGKLLRYNAIQNVYKRAYKALGLPNRSTHVLRHTFATIFCEQTGDIRGAQAALGHRDLRITQHYAKAGERTQRKAMHKFELGKEGQTSTIPNTNTVIALTKQNTP